MSGIKNQTLNTDNFKYYKKGKKMKFLLTIVLGLILSSCASHNIKYSPPTNKQGVTTKTTQTSFKKTWEQLVEGLAGQNFVIDSVNKDSGLIVASKKLNPPSSFADCGNWNGYFKNQRVDEKYDFKGADSATYVVKSGDYYTRVNRTANLNSKSNIFVKIIDQSKTSITVNSQFNLKFDINTSTYIYPQGDVYNKDTLVTEWASLDRGQVDKGGQTQCVSNYNIESSILNLAK